MGIWALSVQIEAHVVQAVSIVFHTMHPCIIHFLLHLHIKVDLYLVLRIYVSLSSPCTELIIHKRLRSPEYREWYMICSPNIYFY